MGLSFSPISHRKQLLSSLVQIKGMYTARGYSPQQTSMSSLPAMNSTRAEAEGCWSRECGLGRQGQAGEAGPSSTGRKGGTGRTDKHRQAQVGPGRHEQEHSWTGRTGRGTEGTGGRAWGVLSRLPRTLPVTPEVPPVTPLPVGPERHSGSAATHPNGS